MVDAKTFFGRLPSHGRTLPRGMGQDAMDCNRGNRHQRSLLQRGLEAPVLHCVRPEQPDSEVATGVLRAIHLGGIWVRPGRGSNSARVLDNGGQTTPITPRKRAELLKADDLYRTKRARLNSQEGMATILESVKELFSEVEKQCKDVKSAYSHLHIKCETNLTEGSAVQSCVLTDGRVEMSIVWHQPYSNTLKGSCLSVQEYYGGLILKRKFGPHVPATAKACRRNQVRSRAVAGAGARLEGALRVGRIHLFKRTRKEVCRAIHRVG